MKKIILSGVLLLLTIYFTSCSKKSETDTPIDTLTQTPTAKAQFDNSNFGIYKGVFVGSSGYIIVDISNSGTTLATLIVNGVVYNFTTSQTVTQGQTTTLSFVSGTSSFTFTVSANGANPTITNLNINGHPNAAILVVKETSTAIVKCFEGNYIGGDAGIFNAVIYNNLIKGLAKSNSNVIYIVSGTVNNNQINATGSVSSGATFVGQLSGMNTSGTWTNGASALNGNWTGVRTY
jgi:hypothetical protein